MGLLTKEVERHPCTVEVSHCFDSLHAHVKFNDGAVVWPGDEVIREDREAVIYRASKLEQLWTRMTGDFEFMELCEFSFSEEVKL